MATFVILIVSELEDELCGFTSEQVYAFDPSPVTGFFRMKRSQDGVPAIRPSRLPGAPRNNRPLYHVRRRWTTGHIGQIQATSRRFFHPTNPGDPDQRLTGGSRYSTIRSARPLCQYALNLHDRAIPARGLEAVDLS